MEPTKIITLTTDFGLRDNYVGQVKGAILAVEPEAHIVDLCHDVPPQDVGAGAFVLETGYAAFPPGSIHIAVVDPGVGTQRRMLAARAGDHFFLAPDNGLLTRVLRREKLSGAFSLQNPSFFGPRNSVTFAGRDVFAPAAAWISRGVRLERLGPPAEGLVALEPLGVRLEPGRAVRVPVVWVDRFGNVVLDVTVEALTASLGHAPDEESPLRLIAEGGEVRRFAASYARAEGAEPFFLINSAGYLEIAVNGGRADAVLGLRAGMHPELKAGR